jgi:hypothetical protein
MGAFGYANPKFDELRFEKNLSLTGLKNWCYNAKALLITAGLRKIEEILVGSLKIYSR